MSSISLPVTAGFSKKAPLLGTEEELIGSAISGNEPAFGELYRRHARYAWRLAVAVAPGSVAARGAVADGFVRALRVSRRRAAASESFRIAVLSGVYLAALELVGRDGNAAAVDPGSIADPDLSAAFLALPERWRAALWLTEVEGFGPAEVAAVIGVSPAVAGPLLDRASRAFSARLGDAPPDPVGPALAPLAAVTPTAVAFDAVGRWRAAVVRDPATRLAGVSDRIGEKAKRTLVVAASGVLALGIVGLGVLSQQPTVGGFTPVTTPNAPGAYGAIGAGHHAAGAGPVLGAFGGMMAGHPDAHAISGGTSARPIRLTSSHGRSVAASAGSATHAHNRTHPTSAASATGRVATSTHHHVAAGGNAGRAAGGTGAAGGAGTGTTPSQGSGGGSTPGAGHGGGGASGGGSGGGQGAGGGGGGGGQGGGGTGGGGTGGGGTGGGVSTGAGQSPVVNVPGVASVSTGSSGTNVSVGNAKNPVVHVSAGSSGTNVSVGTTKHPLVNASASSSGTNVSVGSTKNPVVHASTSGKGTNVSVGSAKAPVVGASTCATGASVNLAGLGVNLGSCQDGASS